MKPKALTEFIKRDANASPDYKTEIMRKKRGTYVHAPKDLKVLFPFKTASLNYTDSSQRNTQSRAFTYARRDLEREQEESGSLVGIMVGIANVNLDDSASATDETMATALSAMDISATGDNASVMDQTMATAVSEMDISTTASAMKVKAPKPGRGRGRGRGGGNGNTLKPISENGDHSLSARSLSGVAFEFAAQKYEVVMQDEQLTPAQKEYLIELLKTGMLPNKVGVYQNTKTFISQLEEWTENINNASSPHRATAIANKENYIKYVFPFL